MQSFANTSKNSLCANCEHCLVFNGIRECEWDMFEPVPITKSKFYTPIDFDCTYFSRKNK